MITTTTTNIIITTTTITIIIRLVPEFPSETLPTLAAIATGQHTEVYLSLFKVVLN